MQINTRQMVLAISRAVDLVGVDDVFHGSRVGMMAVECAKVLGMDSASRQVLLDAGLVHDCGVSSTVEHRKIVDELDWEGAHRHCEKGFALLKDFAPLSHRAPMPAPDILKVLYTMRDAGEVDASLVDILSRHLDECLQLANEGAKA